VCVLSFGLVISCATTRPKKKAQTKKKKNPVTIPMTDLEANAGKRTPKNYFSPELTPKCETAVKSYQDHLKTLQVAAAVNTPLPPDLKAVAQPAREETCPKKIQAVMTAINNHSGKVGVLLPLTGAQANLGNAILKGMQVAARDANVKFDTRFIVRDDTSKPDVAQKLLAQLYLYDQASLVIGGMDVASAKVLADWSTKLNLPVVLLTRDDAIHKTAPSAFRVYPSEIQLATALATAAREQQITRVAVLRPISGKSDRLAQEFADAFTKQGGVVTDKLPYNPTDYASLDALAKSLFKIDPVARRDEYQEAFRLAKKRAEKEGVPFDRRQVVLKPIINIDAVFIPDDFRTLRYFVKVFRYHGVQKLKMIGNHEWRSPALLDPPEELLNGSMFADFIGSYQDVPIQAPLAAGSPYFIQSQFVADVDFNLIGYRAGAVALHGFPQTTKRRAIPTFLSATTLPDGRLFKKGPGFYPDRTVVWPTFVFTIKENTLQMRPLMIRPPMESALKASNE
jgi:hypothetical protein